MASQSTEERELNPPARSADVRALCVQFRRAIAALASDDVAELEASTAAQDGLIAKLQEWFRNPASDRQASARIFSADCKELVHLTRVYSSLLKRAMRTARLREGLCQTYRHSFPVAPEPDPATNWSCEV